MSKVAEEHRYCNCLARDLCKKHKLKISYFLFEHQENDSHWTVLYDCGINIRETVQACCKYSAIVQAIYGHYKDENM